MITFKKYIEILEKKETEFDVTEILIGSKRIKVEIADNNKKRARGMMHRTSLKNNHGMLFLMPRVKRASFWMKNTEVPLSIAFIDPSCKILEMYDMVPNSNERVLSRSFNIAYALEVPMGWFERNKISTGDLVQGLPKIIEEDNTAGGGGVFGIGPSFGHGGDMINSDFYATGYSGVPYIMGSKPMKRNLIKNKNKKRIKKRLNKIK